MSTTVATYKQLKAEGKKISMVTAYDYSTAKLVDRAGIDSILVGDSLGMTMLGYPDTLAVTMEDMIHHAAAVVRGVENALVVVDMPFMSYHTGVADAVRNAGRLIKETGAQAVKLEGGVAFKDEVAAIVRAGIPVMGHIGMTPQSANMFGGFKVQGKDVAKAQQIVDDARALEEAGVFAMVLECVPAPLASYITSQVAPVTIGIGAGANCDGQVLVSQDMLGMNVDFKPKFVRKFGEVGAAMEDAYRAYHEAVRDGSFPAVAESYANMDPEALALLQ